MLSLSMKEALTRLREGSLSAQEITEACITRANKLKELNAFISNTFDDARQAAKDSDVCRQKGEVKTLSGIPVAVKDNFCTKGIPTTCASNMLKNFVPPYNATVVQKLIDHGALLFGKTNMDEFAMGAGTVDSVCGPVRNPWKYPFHSLQVNSSKRVQIELENNSVNATYSKRLHEKLKKNDDLEKFEMSSDWHITGGSSGGSAAAVASGIVFGAMGSDTGGSVRNPASYCGVVGLKPSYGLVSRHGLIPLVNSMDVPGIFTRSVDDAVTLLNVLSGHDPKDSTTVTTPFQHIHLDEFSVRDLHIGIPKEYHSPGLSVDVLEAWKSAADMFENAGAKVSRVSLPHTQYSIKCYNVLACCEIASNMARYDGIEFGHRAADKISTEDLYAATRHEGFSNVVRGRIFAGNYFLLGNNYEDHFLKAQRIRRLISDDYSKVYNSGVDVLLTPVTQSDAPLHSDFIKTDSRTSAEQQDVYTQPVNMAGIPAVVIPVAMSSNDLPISLQFIGQNFQDETLLKVAKWYEKQVQFQQLNLDFLDS